MGLMEGNGLSVADALALQNNGTFGSNGGMWFFFLLFILLIGNGGGLLGNGGAALTRAEMFDGFNNQTVVNKLEGISNGICDGFYAQNTTMLNGFNNTQRAVDQARFDAQACCYCFMAA